MFSRQTPVKRCRNGLKTKSDYDNKAVRLHETGTKTMWNLPGIEIKMKLKSVSKLLFPRL